MAPARAVPAETLAHLAVGVEPSGVVLGRDSAGRAVLVRLFAREPMSVAFVGGWWAARLLLFRCLAHGAAVTVAARDPRDPARPGSVADTAHWLTLDQAAGRGHVTLAAPGSEGPQAGPARPLLRVHDLGPEFPAGRLPRPWQTGLTVLPQVTPASVPLLAAADVLLVQRLPEPEAALLGSALGARADLVSRLPAMDDEMVAAFGAGSVRYAWLTPTPIERHLFG
ncbi:hypothetical protein GCM10022251_25320 [Phytohabitans flavus]|uniref:Uncharacterized protein n=1 Tax=Phytohabitans flavus TaxID=1076124 RepID=A0A6F8XR00_9ACTN|nr:hypothetical protein [Phytohabitans flavus]BCB76264.1 hypothetical protein Pflav_026740 [Phytohabitans flavus]